MPLHDLVDWLSVGLPHIATHFAENHDLSEHSAVDVASSSSTLPVKVHTADDLHHSTQELQKLAGGEVKVDLLNNNNSQYYGDFLLGNPRQRFTGIFDTGSSIVWVPGANCKSDVCNDHHRFDMNSSQDFAGPKADDDTSKGEIHYGTGKVAYEGGMDSLSFCDSHDNQGCHGPVDTHISVSNQPIGMSTEQTNYPFSILPFDGILGLAPSVNSGSVMHQIRASKSLAKNLFGVYLSEDSHRSGSVDFGGVELQHIAPNSPLDWHKISKPSEWTVQMKDILVNGKPLNICADRPDGVCPAVMDTGSSLITGPSGEIEKLLSNVHTDEQCKNLAQMPEISVQLVNKDGQLVNYPLSPKDYTLKSLEEVQNTGDFQYLKEFPVLGDKGAKSPEVRALCEPGLGIMDVPGRKWVLGDTFLRRYYSIYDDDNSMVGIVRSIHPDEAAPSTAPDASSAPTSAPAGQEAAAASVVQDTKAAAMPAVLAWMCPPRPGYEEARRTGPRKAVLGDGGVRRVRRSHQHWQLRQFL